MELFLARPLIYYRNCKTHGENVWYNEDGQKENKLDKRQDNGDGYNTPHKSAKLEMDKSLGPKTGGLNSWVEKTQKPK